MKRICNLKKWVRFWYFCSFSSSPARCNYSWFPAQGCYTQCVLYISASTLVRKNHHVMLSSSFPRVSHPLHLEQRETIFGVLTVLLTFAKVTTEKVVWEGFSQDVFSYLIEILTVTFEMIKEYYSSWNRTERRIIAKPAGTVTGKLSWLTSSPQSCLYTWYRKSPLQWSHRVKITWRVHSVSSCLAHFSYMDVTSSHDASFSNCPQLHSSLFSFLRCSCTKWTVKNIGSRWQRHASRAFRAS